MARIELGKPAIQAALRDAGDERVILRDIRVPGLSAIIRNGQVRLEYSYRPRGMTAEGARWPMRYVSLGLWPNTSLSDARAEAQKLKLAAADGFDPAAERDQRRDARVEQRKSDITVSKAVDFYVSTKLNNGGKHHRNEAGHLRRAIGELGIDGLSLKAVEATHLLDLEVIHAKRPATARGRIGSVQRFFAEGARRGLIDADPSARLRLPPPPRPRQLRLSVTDIPALWNCEHPKRAFLRAMLLLPLRFGELASLRADNIKDGWIVLPKTKNGDPFALPLSAPAKEIMADAMAKAGSGLLFPGLSATSRITDQIRDASGVKHFQWHDLRRLFVSTLADHEIGDPDLLDGLLNHRGSETRGGIRAAYQQSQRRQAKLRVMEAWGRMVVTAARTGQWEADDSDVIPLRRG